MEEQRGQALRGGGGLYDLLLCDPRLQLLPPQEGLSDLQEEVPLGVFGEPLIRDCVANRMHASDGSLLTPLSFVCPRLSAVQMVHVQQQVHLSAVQRNLLLKAAGLL